MKIGKFSQIVALGAISAQLIQLPALAEVIHNENGPPGYYSVGEWIGRCRRDGWLDMAKNESCGAQLKAFVTVDLARTVKGLTASIMNQGCPRGLMQGKMNVKALAATNRAETLEKLIQKLIAKQQKKCGKEGEMYPIERADLADILTETDGLEF